MYAVDVLASAIDAKHAHAIVRCAAFGLYTLVILTLFRENIPRLKVSYTYYYMFVNFIFNFML